MGILAVDVLECALERGLDRLAPAAPRLDLAELEQDVGAPGGQAAGLVEERRRRCERSDRAGVGRGANELIHREVVTAGEAQMSRDLRCPAGASVTVLADERARERLVQPRALGVGNVAVDCLAHQRVAVGDRPGAGDEQPGLDDAGRGFDDVQPERRALLERQGPTRHCGELGHQSPFLRERAKRRTDRPAQARRGLSVAGGKGPGPLEREQRVAVRGRDDPLHLDRGQSGDALDQSGQRVVRQRPQAELDGEDAAGAQGVLERIDLAAMGHVAVGQEHQHGQALHAPADVGGQLEAGCVGEVDVLEQEHQ